MSLCVLHCAQNQITFKQKQDREKRKTAHIISTFLRDNSILCYLLVFEDFNRKLNDIWIVYLKLIHSRANVVLATVDDEESKCVCDNGKRLY